MNKDQSLRNIQSVQRAIDIINCVGNSSHELTLKEISQSLDININTARGLVNTLLNNGFLSKNITANRYFLGYEFLSKSQLVYQSHIRHIRDIAYPLMEAIARNYAVSCWLQVSFYKDIYTVETVMSSNCHYSYTPRSGARLPLHSTASGKLLVAYLPFEDTTRIVESIVFEKFTKATIDNKETFYRAIDQVRQLGYSTEFEETDLAISSVAAPFFAAKGMMAGTISITAPAPTIDSIYKEAIADLLKAANLVTSEISAKKKPAFAPQR